MESDLLLRRVERRAVLVCLGLAAIGWAIWGAAAGLSVLGGGLLSAVSYRTIVATVTALTRPPAAEGEGDGTPRSPGRVWTLLRAGFRYALLTLLAYVMIARLRLPPLGVLAGASSVVAAIAFEIVRIVRGKPERPARDSRVS